MNFLSIIKTILDIFKHLREFSKNKSKEEKTDLTIMSKKLSSVEKELRQIKDSYKDIENKGFNQIQTKLKYVFNSHGIDDNLIAEFIVQYIDSKIIIPISEKENLHFILDKLSDENINDILNLFEINKGWLFDKEDLYSHTNYYNNINNLITFVTDKHRDNEKIKGFVLKEKTLNKNNDENQSVFVVFRTPVGQLYGYNKTIYKYYPIATDWKWNYWKTRCQLKSIFYLSDKYNQFLELNGVHIKNDKDFEMVTSLNFCPHKIIEENTKPYSWYPYDYVTNKNQNIHALEIDEIERIIDYIKDNKYIDYFERKIGLKF